jgi:predicted metal-dependent hydrolase
MRITVHSDGSVSATKPTRMATSRFISYLNEHIAWIEKKVSFFASQKKTIHTIRHTKTEYAYYKQQASLIAKDRLEYFNQWYGFSYNNIVIRNQKSRWGSCSKKGNLNFNYKIALLPQELSDYIIVHELCHLGAFNHSKEFWKLVERTIPHHKELRSRLKNDIQLTA